MKIKKRILVAPLNWGIGHATRCIPIIKELHLNNYEVLIAADGRPMHLLKSEFPQINIIHFEGYNIKYPTYLPMSIAILLQIPKIIWNINKENIALNKMIKHYNIDGVISDNRFGLFNNKVPSVFITHQLEIQSPLFTRIIQKLNYQYINRFSYCWIMDDKKNNFAGHLSMPKKIPNNSCYIGAQSRFRFKKTNKKYDFLAIVSGPESQRKILEKRLINTLEKRKEESIIILGKPELMTDKKIGNVTIKSHLNAEELNQVILESELIICRPGYSTIMDLAKLMKKAFFIPTPGQTEQEYLAKLLYKKNICYFQNQNQFNFEKGIEEAKKFTGFKKIKNAKTNWKELFSIF